MRKKWPGRDGVFAETLRHADASPLVVKLIQDIWRAGRIPVEWTRNELVHVPKGDNKWWRGIALSVTSKVLTYILLKRAHGTPLLHNQYGFRMERSTVQAIRCLKDG